MLTAEELEQRSALIAESDGLQALAARLEARVRLVLTRDPAIPTIKGMLTADGGLCPADGAALLFDPWSPADHRCSRCGQVARGERHNQRWAWHQHLWLAERITEAATVGLLTGDRAATVWAAGKLEAYAERYFAAPNADNVLGPSHLFSSTYLESIWLTNYLAAACMLREVDALYEPAIDAVSKVTEEAANLIGEFDEGLSNRQTWHNAALTAAAVWFGDEELAARGIDAPHGLLGHLVDGFRPDGMWYEGENYHLFALRGMLVGAAWARLAGADLFDSDASRARWIAALRAPILTALPDGSFPARKDSRFGVSLAQPMYLELWECGLALLPPEETAAIADLSAWLTQRYQDAAPAPQVFDSYLHEAGEAVPVKRGREHLSSWMLLTMLPGLPAANEAARTVSVLLPEQGLAVLRDGDRYASVECGAYGGGHGHPDRLHLSLFAGGTHWLADPGTGTYVAHDLFWYRSTLAHNAPRLDGRSQPMDDARCEAFDQAERWGWIRGAVGRLVRTTVAGPDHLLDVVEWSGDDARQVELPWHLAGWLEVLSPGRWEPAELTEQLVDSVERFVPEDGGVIRLRATPEEGASLEGLELILDGSGELLRATGPGRPDRPARRSFLVRRHTGRYVRFIAVLRWSGAAITSLRVSSAEVVVETVAGAITHRQTAEGWEILEGGSRVALKGLRKAPTLTIGITAPTLAQFIPPVAIATRIDEPPLDGSLAGFDLDAPLLLDHEDQYRRSEEPYAGPEAFSAQASLGWDDNGLYLGIDVVHPQPVFPETAANPLKLDNEPDLIHADGLQLYLRRGSAAVEGWLIVPDPQSDALVVRSVSDATSDPAAIEGRWMRTETGYSISLGIVQDDWPPAPTEEIGFDLLVNVMEQGRHRRAGQLVWSGGAGWVYLRGDRQSPARFGRIQFA